MSRQRSSMAEIQTIAPEAPEERDAPATAPEDPNARKKVSLYIKQAHYRSIRKASADRDLKMHEVVDEALSEYFRKNGYQP